MRHLIQSVTVAMLLCSCNRGDYVDVIRLGALEKEMVLSERAVEDTVCLLTNVPYEVEVVEGQEWLTLAGSGMMPSSRREIPFRCQENISWRRMAKVTLSHSTRVDTVCIKQQGALLDRVALKYNSFEVPAGGGTYSTEVECFRSPVNLLVETSVSGWQASVQDGVLTVVAAPAVSRDPKNHTVTVYYIDGWGERAAATAVFIQAPKE